jgi:hypothetical protein
MTSSECEVNGCVRTYGGAREGVAGLVVRLHQVLLRVVLLFEVVKILQKRIVSLLHPPPREKTHSHPLPAARRLYNPTENERPRKITPQAV